MDWCIFKSLIYFFRGLACEAILNITLLHTYIVLGSELAKFLRMCRPKTVVLGSRQQLCIHDEVSLLDGRAQTNACHFLCRKRGKTEKDEKHCCRHYSRVAGIYLQPFLVYVCLWCQISKCI